MKPFLRGALTLALPALVAGLLVAELLGRTFVPDPPPDFVVQTDSFDSTYHHPYSFRPGEFPKPEARLTRVLFLGDSFTEGTRELTDSSATIPNFAAAALGRCGVPAAALNLGVSSYSPIIEYLILKNVGLALKPDAVVLLLDEGDVQDDAIYTSEAVLDAAGAPVRVGAGTLSYAHPAFRSWLVRRSIYAWEILRDLRSGITASRMPAQATALQRYNQRVFRHRSPWRTFITLREDGSDPPDDPRFAHPIFHPAFRMSYNHPGSGADYGAYYAQTLRYVGMIADLCRREGIPLLVATYPYPFAVDPSPAASPLRRKWGYPAGGVLDSAFLPAVAAWAASEGVAHLDLTDHLLRQTDRLPGYYFNGSDGGVLDEHFNESGNAVVGDFIGAGLCRLSHAPREPRPAGE